MTVCLDTSPATPTSTPAMPAVTTTRPERAPAKATAPAIPAATLVRLHRRLVGAFRRWAAQPPVGQGNGAPDLGAEVWRRDALWAGRQLNR